MLVRLLFWLLLALAGWWLYRSGARPAKPVRRARADTDRTPLAPMQQCAVCGVHFPDGEGLEAQDGRAFCSSAHKNLALNAHSR